MFRFYFAALLLQSYFVLGQSTDLKQNQIFFEHYAQDKGLLQESGDSTYASNQKPLPPKYDPNFIEFTVFNFSNIEKKHYQHPLRKIEPTYIFNQNRRSANYINLPLFWDTWGFRVALIILLFGGIYGVYRYRIYQLKDRQAHELSVSIKAQELERQRFAQELHDGVGANLALLQMYLHSIGDPKIVPEELRHRSINLLKDSIEEIRRLIHDMHPRSLSQYGLVGTVDEMTKRINDSQQLTVCFEGQQAGPKLPENVEMNLFRVVQELLQNTLKHAHATDVWLSILCESDTLFLRYRDNGCGVDRALLNKKNGNGLVNMRQRIELLKGTYQLAFTENAGTTVEISVPIPA